MLLQNGVSVELSDLDFVVYTDRKWVCFLLGQLLQNAARYRRARPVIILSARRQEKRVELTVSDNGMGIPAHELPRVFDRGFTGSNGRLRGGSTGMGLYLAKKLADALEISLAIRSEEGWAPRCCSPFPPRKSLQNCKIRNGETADTTGRRICCMLGLSAKEAGYPCCKYRTLRNTMAARTK